MKKFLTCALCFMPSIAGAVTLYYTPGRECPGLYLNSAEIGCPADSLRVTQLNVASRADADFTGYKVGDTVIIDSLGRVSTGAVAALATSAASGNTVSKVTGDYTCQTGSRENRNGVCVAESALGTADTENFTYIDWDSLTPVFNANGAPSDFSGGEIAADDVGDNGRGGCQYYRKFKVKFHWCPETYETFTWRWANTGSVPQGYTAAEGPGLWPSGCVDGPTYDYEWKNPTDLTPGNATYKDSGGNIVNRLNVPSNFDSNWTLRGFYLLNYPTQPSGSNCQPGDHNVLGNNLPAGCIQYWGYRNTIANNLVTSNTNTWGRARLGLKKNSSGDLNYIPLNDVLENYANSRWQIWSCTEIKPTDVIHLYAGWARNCEPGDSNATCSLDIKRTGLSNPDKGDAIYTTTCPNGSTPTNNGAYNPSCASTDIRYSYKANKCQSSGILTNGLSCALGTTITLENPSCDTDWELKGWRNSATNTNHAAGAMLTCDMTTMGASPVTFNAIECLKCIPPEHGTCPETSPVSACNEPQCERGYKLQKIESSGELVGWECVPE